MSGLLRLHVAVLGATLLAASLAAKADEDPFRPGGFPHPPYPAGSLRNGDGGTVLIQVVFGADGRVASCQVVDSNASDLLQKSTVNFITANWKNKKLAGRTFSASIDYDVDGRALPLGMSPPNFLSPGDPPVTMRLNVSFDSAGSPSDIFFVKSSGIKSIDRKTAAWVRTHWRTRSYANRSLTVPISFEAVPATGK